MDHKDFLLVADIWINGATEAEWRSAISRSYYAAFHESRTLLTACGFLVPYGERAHRYLILRLTNSGQSAVGQAGRDLDVLRRHRNDADYDLHLPLLQKTAAPRVHKAKAIIRVLEAAAANPVIKAQITDAMRIYERDTLQDVTWRP